MVEEFGIGLFTTLQEQLRATNDPRDAERARYIGIMLESRGEELIYHPRRTLEATITKVTAQPTSTARDLFAEVYPEISLPEERRRQGLILARRFAGRLGLSDEAYIATLPEFPEKPSTYDGLGLTVPIIFETRISWLESAELSGIYVSGYLRERMMAGEVIDWEGINFDMPKVPFTAWVQDGTKFVYRKPSEVRKALGKGENREYVAGSILPAISMYAVRPDMVSTMFWDIIGTKVGSGGVPCFSRWDGEPWLGASGVGNADPGFRAFVLGREIRTLNLAA